MPQGLRGYVCYGSLCDLRASIDFMPEVDLNDAREWT